MGASRRSCLQVSGTLAQKCVWNLRVGGVVRAGNVLDSNETFHNQKYLAQDYFTLLFHLGYTSSDYCSSSRWKPQDGIICKLEEITSKNMYDFKSWWGSKSSKCFVLY